MKTIEVIIATDGSTRLETTGFQGPSCTDASRYLEQALGSNTSEQLTPDYHSSVCLNPLHGQQGA